MPCDTARESEGIDGENGVVTLMGLGNPALIPNTRRHDPRELVLSAWTES
jgi:hypothetical protein